MGEKAERVPTTIEKRRGWRGGKRYGEGKEENQEKESKRTQFEIEEKEDDIGS